MKITDKLKSYSFWVSLTSAIILILKLLGEKFGFTVDESFISDMITSICSVLVLLGIIISPSANKALGTNISEKENIANAISEKILDSSTMKPLNNSVENEQISQDAMTIENENNSNFNLETVSNETTIKEEVKDSELKNLEECKPETSLETINKEENTCFEIQEIDTVKKDNNDLEILFGNMLVNYKQELNLDTETFMKYLENELEKIKPQN